MKNKKSFEMAFNVIIAAALALIVMIVLIAIFTGRINVFNTAISSCADKQGICETDSSACAAMGRSSLGGTDCAKLDKARPACCIPVGNKMFGESCASNGDCISGKCEAGRCS